jgi:hypothetical protein
MTAVCPVGGRAPRYQPSLLGGGAVVPYIGRWSGEESVDTPVIRRTDGGVGYPDETVLDRDRRGVLWARAVHRIGAGRPLFGKVHPWRQRRAMSDLLCQVCAQPADRTDEGTLWLVPGVQAADWNGWPAGMATVHPPLCLACARISVRMCPGMRPHYVALRARSRVCGVTGVVFRPAGLTGLVRDDYPQVLTFDDPALSWTVATQLARTLVGVTTVDLERLS